MVDLENPPSINEDIDCYLTKSEKTNLVAALRLVFSRSVFAKKCRQRNKSKTVGVRGGMRIDCQICGKPFKPNEIELHHKIAIVEIGKHYYEYSLDDLVSRLWCGYSGILAICKSCHAIITATQREERKKND